MPTRLLLAGIAVACGAQPSHSQHNPSMIPQQSGTTVLLQAVSVVDEQIVWVSGHRGTFVRTVDGGRTWHVGRVPDADTLQFRDVHAVDANTAYLLAAGPGDMSRIYKTTDAGESWELQFVNADPDAFFDCFDFWDADHGIAMSDAVGGRLIVIQTSDGASWTAISSEQIPPARGSEGGFAASGTCLVTQGDADAWIGSGAGEVARVYRTRDRGDTWTVSATPIVSGTGSSGITSLVVFDENQLLALGGEIADTVAHTDNVAISGDGGMSWELVGRPVFPGAVYGAANVSGADHVVVAAGPQGLDYSIDRGREWTSLDTLSYWAVGFASPRAGWAVGPGGRIAKIDFN